MAGKFRPGSVVATPGALEAMGASGVDPLSLLSRHINGDWGDVDEETVLENNRSLEHGWRVLSSYNLPSGERVWIITEADRSSTCFLLPEEY